MGNLRKAINYAKKNGIREMFYTAAERIGQKKEAYRFEPVSEEIWKKQRDRQWEHAPKISILVPAYETKTEYMKAVIESVLAQSYENWELIIADASSSDLVKEALAEFHDERICYHRLSENQGISENSNEGLRYVSGDYVALLDHDDLLTSDALYEMVQAVGVMQEQGKEPLLIYSDEDKCNKEGNGYSCPHRKLDFNLDLFLTNNYICHFTMIRADMIKELGFRQQYDGAQDYDLFLRVVLLIMRLTSQGTPAKRLADRICHVPRVLYHWRCHESSTATNPESKMYAYEAGRCALEDWYQRMGIKAEIVHSKHLGFYDTVYVKNLFQSRPDIGVIGGKLTHGGKVTGGAMDADGRVIYAGLSRKFSGYMNRAVMTQDVTALDLRCMKVRPELKELYMEYLTGMAGKDPVKASLDFSRIVREKGYFLYYLPTFEEKI